MHFLSPDLEYYFLYPHLDRGALLILDDIHIRSINNLFEFLRRDAMFHLDEVVRTTAFFTRTEAPVFDPLDDNWRRRKKDLDGWWPQTGGAIPVADESWVAQVNYGNPSDAGFQFEIAAVVVCQRTHELWTEWVRSAALTGEFPPVRLPLPPAVLAEAYRTVRKEMAR